MPLAPTQIRELSQLDPKRFWIAVLVDYLTIAFLLYLCVLTRNYGVYFFSMIVIGARQHALSILAHECMHNVAFKNHRLNSWIGTIFCFSPSLLSMAHLKNFHLQHHRHTNTALDPELEYRAFFSPLWTLPFNLPRLIGVSLLDLSGLGVFDAFYVARYMKIESILELITPYILWLVFVFSFIKLDLLIVPVITYISLITFSWAFMRNRARFEHLGTEGTHRYDVHPVIAYFLFPHNIWYHYEHHRYVTIPFYNLPKARGLDLDQEVISFKEMCSFLSDQEFEPKIYLKEQKAKN